MTDVGELFVRIRPAPGSAAAFEAEASPGVASAGKSLAKTFLAAFAIGGIAETIKSAISASTEHQAAFAVLSQTTKDAGASNELYGQTIEDLLEKEARLKGFTDEDLASSFTRLVSATKNSQEAFKDLGLAEDVARARHIDLANAALAISKAEQGSATALQRLGIVVPAVTTNVDALKTAHENAIVAGAKFTDQQKQEYAQALVNAGAADKQATRVQDLAVIQQRFGGDAASFADTAAGGFARLEAEFHQFEVTLGTNVLPLLLSGAQDAVEFVKALDNPAVIGAVGTYAAVKVALEGISLAQKAYQGILVAGGASVAADTTAETAYTAAIAANTEALIANAAAAGESSAANALRLGGGFSTIPVRGAAAAEEGATVAAPAAEETGSFVAGLTALATGPQAAVLAIAALAGGVAYLATRESDTTKATHGLSDALDALGTSASALPTDRIAISQDRLNVAQDNAALSASKASHSSLEYQQLLLNLSRDTLQLEADQKTLQNGLQQTATDFDTAKQKVADLIAQYQKEEKFIQGINPAPGLGQQVAVTSAANAIQKQIDDEKNLTPLQAHNLQLLEDYLRTLGNFPDKVQTNAIFNNKDATLSLTQLIDKIEGLPAESAAQSKAAGAQIVGDINQGVLEGAAQFGLKGIVQGEIDSLGSLVPDATAQGENIGSAFFNGVETALHSLDSVFAAVKAQVAANAQLAQTVNPLQSQVAQDKADLADLQQQATDAATQGAQALANAIQSAKQNLDTIGQSIADSLTTYIDKPLNDAATRIQNAEASLSLLNDKLSLSRLGEEVILPGNQRISSDPSKAIAQLEALQKSKGPDPALAAFILQFRSLALQVEGDQNTVAQNAANLVTTAAKTQLANLTDLFNTGKISQGTLEKDITDLLEKNGLNPKTARTRGASFADTLAGELAGVGQQADALKGFGKDSGLIPSITRPLDTLNETQKTLAGIASSERAKQLSESKTQTKVLKDIHAAQAADTFTNSLGHNPGVGNTRTKRLVGVGG